MKKQELVAGIAEKTGVGKKTVLEIMEAISEAAKVSLKRGDPFRILGLGTLKTVVRAEREYSNPIAGHGVSPAKTVVKFTAAKDILD